MLELFVFGMIVIVGLLLLIALPLVLLGMAFKLLAAIVLLPFKLLGALFSATGSVLGGLFKGLFSLFGALAGLALVVLLIVAFPVGIVVLAALALAGLVKLLVGGAVAAT